MLAQNVPVCRRKIRKRLYNAMVYVMSVGIRRILLYSILLPVRGLRARRLLAVHLGLQHLLVHALDRRDSNALTRPVVVNREGPVWG